jgi:hypothetical protein
VISAGVEAAAAVTLFVMEFPAPSSSVTVSLTL